MFGYIKVYKPELKMKEFELYKGVYCSLCKQLGKSYGLFSRFFLNYDFAFLSLCLLASEKEECEFEKSHCSFCFTKKCTCCKLPADSLEYSAAITIITAYHKLLDNIADGKFFNKLFYCSLLPVIKIKYKKAAKKYPEISKIIEDEMSKQKDFEKNKIDSIDQAADSTAISLGKIISNRFDDCDKEIGYRFGYCLGRFIYICDALDDLENDFKKKNFNPFLLKNNSIDFTEIRSNAFSVLDTTSDELAKAYELINFFKYKPILDNIIYYGLDTAINRVLRREENGNEKPL